MVACFVTDAESLSKRTDTGVVVWMVLYAKASVLRAVWANWNDNGWNVNANELDYNNWNENRRVFSRAFRSR